VDASQPQLELSHGSLEELERDLDENLSHGRAFVPGAGPLPERSVCTLRLLHPLTGASHCIEAEVVWVVVGGAAAGVGVMFRDFDPAAGERLSAFVAQAAGQKKRAVNMMERVRSYSTSEQMRRARDGELTERTALERVYGKGVWEPLLQNQRISPPEVARIARKGGLPKPLVDIITGQPAWLASPEIRRALLTNPRVTGPALERVLAPCSPRDLELIASQVLYPIGVRQAAKRKIRR